MVLPVTPSSIYHNYCCYVRGPLLSPFSPVFSRSTTTVAFATTSARANVHRGMPQHDSATKHGSTTVLSRSKWQGQSPSRGGYVDYDSESGSASWVYGEREGLGRSGRGGGGGNGDGGRYGGGRTDRGSGADRTGQYRDARREKRRGKGRHPLDGDRGQRRGGDGRGGRGRDGGNYGGGRDGGQRRGRGGRGDGRGRSGRGRGVIDSEIVMQGKALAGRIKEQGYKRDWKGILASLEEGPRNAIVCTVAINALGKIGKWYLGLDVLNDMGVKGDGTDKPRADAYVYAAAINACGKAGKAIEAVALLEQMEERRIQPDEVCYGATIAALSEVAGSETRSTWGAGERTAANLVAPPPPTARNSGEEEDEEEEEEGDDSKDATVTVEDVDVSDGNDDGDNAIGGGPDGGAGSGSTAPAVFSMRAHEKAVALIQKMRQNGPRPNEQCFASAITACARAIAPKAALRLLGIMREDGVAPNSVALNAAVDACGKGNAPDEAVRLLRGMERAYGVKPDQITYNSAISALSRAGRSVEARVLLEEMSSKGLKADRISYAAAMQGFATAGDSGNASKLAAQMKSSGLEMDVVNYGTAISACGKAGDVKGAMKLLKEMKAAELEANVVVYNSALDACSRAGKPKMAKQLIDMMKDSGVAPDATSYTGAIAACAQAGDGDMAMEWLRVMMKDGITPETICYNYAMSACGKSGKGDEAAWIMSEMRRQGVTPNKISYSAAMFALGKAGRLNDVLDLLNEMHKEGVQADEVTYHIAVDAAAIAGELGVAINLFRDMRARGLPVAKRRVQYIRDKMEGMKYGQTRSKADEKKTRADRTYADGGRDISRNAGIFGASPSERAAGAADTAAAAAAADDDGDSSSSQGVEAADGAFVDIKLTLVVDDEKSEVPHEEHARLETTSEADEPDLSFLNDLGDGYARTGSASGAAGAIENDPDADTSPPASVNDDGDLLVTPEVVDASFVADTAAITAALEPEAEATDDDLATLLTEASAATATAAATATPITTAMQGDGVSSLADNAQGTGVAAAEVEPDDVVRAGDMAVTDSSGFSRGANEEDRLGEGRGGGDARLLDEIKTMTVPKLKARLRERGLRSSGNKPELFARLEESLKADMQVC